MPHIILIMMVTIVADHQKIVTEASNKQQLIVSLNNPSLRTPNFFLFTGFVWLLHNKGTSLQILNKIADGDGIWVDVADLYP